MALDLRQIFVSAQYLVNKLTDSHQILYMHSYWQDLAWDSYTIFSDIFTRVMALDLRQNFVSAHYLENNWLIFTKFYIYVHIDKI